MNNQNFAVEPGRMWVVPEEATFGFTDDAGDTPIFYDLFYRHFPIRWALGGNL